MFTFAVDYFILVFVASAGVMQTAASIGGLRGLLVFKRPLIARPLGIAVAVAAITWFFLSAERNINDYAGGLDSNMQGLLFFLAVAASGTLTCLLTSPLNKRMRDNERAPDAGLGALRRSCWWHALAHNYRYWFIEAECWRTQIKRYLLG